MYVLTGCCRGGTFPIASVDALVIGRNTYEVVLDINPWPYGDKPVFVSSSQPLEAAPPGAIVARMSGAPQEIVSALTRRGIGHVYVDGGTTIQSFLNAGLIQCLTITRVPVIIVDLTNIGQDKHRCLRCLSSATRTSRTPLLHCFDSLGVLRPET